MSMNKKLILITGATAGIGEATAYVLAAQGHELILVGRNPEKTDRVTQQIRAKTGNLAIHALLADFSDLEQVRQLAVQVKQKFPPLDVLVNNAGIRSYEPLAEAKRETWERIIAVNLLSYAYLSREALPALRSNRGTR
jgi:NAD(P)-dependent dehydrogenase (short-subunit alcohol dehydrogenase family)